MPSIPKPLFCVQSCNSDHIFSLRWRNINFLSTPLRLAPLLFFHPWHIEEKTTGLVYTDTCVSITWNARLLLVNPFDPSLSSSHFFVPLPPPGFMPSPLIGLLWSDRQTAGERETRLTLLWFNCQLPKPPTHYIVPDISTQLNNIDVFLLRGLLLKLQSICFDWHPPVDSKLVAFSQRPGQVSQIWPTTKQKKIKQCTFSKTFSQSPATTITTHKLSLYKGRRDWETVSHLFWLIVESLT